MKGAESAPPAKLKQRCRTSALLPDGRYLKQSQNPRHLLFSCPNAANTRGFVVEAKPQ